MKYTIATIYYLCDEFLKIMEYSDNEQASVSSAEVMTMPLVASVYFGGNMKFETPALAGIKFSALKKRDGVCNYKLLKTSSFPMCAPICCRARS